MFSENVKHFNNVTIKGAKDGVVEHPTDIKDDNESKYICTVNPGVKNCNRGRKLQEESNNTQRINDRAWKVDQ